MNEDGQIVELLEKQNDLLDQIAQLIVDQQSVSAQRHFEMVSKLDSLEAFLSMIQGNTEN